MLLHCLRLLFVNILRLFVAVIPLHNKMCCQALNVLMELREGSGAEGVVSKYAGQEGNSAVRSVIGETTRTCMKSRALLLRCEYLSRHLPSARCSQVST